MDSNLLVKASKPNKPLLQLKDYLLDDLNSCSSNGFRTYPRRQCCTTVRFLLEIDMKNKQAMYKKKGSKLIKNNGSSSSSTTKLSAFQKASEVILTAVKQFGFTVVKSATLSSSSQTKNIATLSRSLSRKLIKNSFWKKNDRKLKPSEVKLEFESLNRTTNNSDDRIVKRVGVTVGDDRDSMNVTTSTNSSSSTTNSTNSKKSWRNEEEKEQFSPVSVLDCPFDDEDEVSSSSPFRHKLSHVEGTKKKLMKKLRKFELLAQLEPLNLETRLACDHESIHCAAELDSSESSLDKFVLITEEDAEEEKPLKLLEFIKATMPSCSFKSKPDNLLLDFFTERLSDDRIEETKGYTEVLSVAKDWINGKHREFSVEWEVKKNRQAFITDMEKRGEWKKLDEEIAEMAVDLEDEIFGSLLNEMMDDMFPGVVIV